MFVPKTIILGIYKCLSYGNEEQLFYLMCSLAIFIINVRCSKVAGVEDFAILVFFIYVMHYFSKIEKENLYLQKYSDFAKVLMSLMYRQNKANKKASDDARKVAKEIRRLGNNPRPSESKPQKVFVFELGQKKDKKEELPKKDKQHDIPKSSIIELGQDEYKRVKDDNEFGGYIEGGNLDDDRWI